MGLDKALFRQTLTAVVIAAVVAGLFAVIVGISQYHEPGSHTNNRLFFVEKGATSGVIASRAHREGVLSNPFIFKIAVRALGLEKSLRAGEYEIVARTSVRDFIHILMASPSYQRHFLVKEGETRFETIENLSTAFGLTGEVPVFDEGSILPETYAYTRGESRSALVTRMQNAMNKQLERLFAGHQQSHLSRHEIITLASIVEKETALECERPIISAVFLNRLKKGMRLQADSTVIYGRTGGASFGRTISQGDLRDSNPYNTYRIKGLPPGPIASPGTSSLKAVLSPSNVPYLYFVADGSGGHVFAETLSDHNKNVARWRAFKNRNQISKNNKKHCTQDVMC